MLENWQAECFKLQWWLDDLKRKKESLEGDRVELAKGPLTTKSVFFLELKCSE